MALDDYTHLPVGTKVGVVAIEVCPHCKRNGLPVTLIGGGVIFNHRQELAAATADNLPLAVWDSCPRINAH
ncbi:MAG: hypothetical protein ABSD59_08500 [Terracidiphilus sp.]